MLRSSLLHLDGNFAVSEVKCADTDVRLADCGIRTVRNRLNDCVPGSIGGSIDQFFVAG